MNNKYIIAIISIIIVVGVVWVIAGKDKDDITVNAPAPADVSTHSEEKGNGANFSNTPVSEDYVSVKNQALSGNTITVSEVSLSEPGFVAIHMDNNGKPGRVIGKSGVLTAGIINDLNITLEETVSGGVVLYAMLHKDANNNGIFDFPGADTPVKSNNFIAKFKILGDEQSQPEQQQGAQQNDSSSVKELNMVSGNLFFTPDNLELKKGQPVRITFQNTGIHTFTIDELGVDVPLRGPSAVVDFTPNKEGQFEYYCAIPGHREGGMLGDLTVVN